MILSATFYNCPLGNGQHFHTFFVFFLLFCVFLCFPLLSLACSGHVMSHDIRNWKLKKRLMRGWNSRLLDFRHDFTTLPSKIFKNGWNIWMTIFLAHSEFVKKTRVSSIVRNVLTMKPHFPFVRSSLQQENEKLGTLKKTSAFLTIGNWKSGTLMEILIFLTTGKLKNRDQQKIDLPYNRKTEKRGLWQKNWISLQ